MQNNILSKEKKKTIASGSISSDNNIIEKTNNIFGQCDMENSFTLIIPARYNSSRLPGKIIADIDGLPMVAHVINQSSKSSCKRIIVATDDQQVVHAINSAKINSLLLRPNIVETVITSNIHNSGTERIAEVINILNIDDNEIIVNVQGDEPLIPPAIIDQVANNLRIDEKAKIATLAECISYEDAKNPNIVKVITDSNNYAIYFSRSLIPYPRDLELELSEIAIKPNYLRHIGIYAYSSKFIKEYVKLPSTSLEQLESLEQLRAIYHQHKIHIDIACEPSERGVDTYEDLKYIVEKIKSNKVS